MAFEFREETQDKRPWNLAFGLGSLGVALMMFATAASVYPYAVPPALTLAAAASPTLTLTIMLILIGVLLPVMLIYNGYQYWVFRGKTPESGYGAYEE